MFSDLIASTNWANVRFAATQIGIFLIVGAWVESVFMDGGSIAKALIITYFGIVIILGASYQSPKGRS